MKVYVLFSVTYNSKTIHGVFLTHALAQKFASDFDILGWEVKEFSLVVR